MTTLTPRLGPYMGVTRDEKRGRYRLIKYNAYNAFGLIGTEYNGIAVLDDRLRAVLTDNLGVGLPSFRQDSLLDDLLECTPECFAGLINASPRARYTITPEEVTA